MNWRDFEKDSGQGLRWAFGDRVVDHPQLEDGTIPDHVRVSRLTGRPTAVFDSKAKQWLTHADVDKLVRDRENLGVSRAGFIVLPETEASDAVLDRLEEEGVEVLTDPKEQLASDAGLLTVGTALGAGVGYFFGGAKGAGLGGFIGLALLALAID